MGGGPGGSGGGWKGQGGADELRAMARFVMSYCVPVCVILYRATQCKLCSDICTPVGIIYVHVIYIPICTNTYIHTYMQLKRRQPWAPSLNRS